MTRFRYWLADLISGGELTFQRNGWARSVAIERETEAMTDEACRLLFVLGAIEAATRDGKSGTAQKINRMAREALE